MAVKAGFGPARHGKAGPIIFDVVVMARPGEARRGGVWSGEARISMRGSGVGEEHFPHARAELFWHGSHGLAGLGRAGCGEVRHGKAWQFWRGPSWYGTVGRGKARQGKAV